MLIIQGQEYKDPTPEAATEAYAKAVGKHVFAYEVNGTKFLEKNAAFSAAVEWTYMEKAPCEIYRLNRKTGARAPVVLDFVKVKEPKR